MTTSNWLKHAIDFIEFNYIIFSHSRRGLFKNSHFIEFPIVNLPLQSEFFSFLYFPSIVYSLDRNRFRFRDIHFQKKTEYRRLTNISIKQQSQFKQYKKKERREEKKHRKLMAKSMIRRPNTFLYAVSGSKTWHTYKLLCLAVVYRHRTHASKTVFSVHFRFVFFSPNFHSLLAGLPSRYKQ